MFATIPMFLFFSPVFDGIYDFCSMYTGATMEGCVKLNNRVSFPIVYNVYLSEPHRPHCVVVLEQDTFILHVA